MRHVNRTKKKKHRKQKLAYSLPLLGLLCMFIFAWYSFQATTTTSIPSGRHLLEESDSDFPDDGFTLSEKRNGYIVFHLFFMIYMFLGLAKICDDYFEPTLEVLCEALNIEDDVAGATWMAAGGSAPELFTSIIGVFFAKSDIGFGTIVGSAVFNVLAVISVCAYCVPNLPVTGWPLARDSIYYCFGILLIIACVEDQKVYWYEALILLIFYIVYVYIMKFNAILERIVSLSISNSDESYSTLRKRIQDIMEHSLTQVLIFSAIIVNVTFVIYLLFSEWYLAEQINEVISLLFVAEMMLKLYCYGPLSYWVDVWNAIDGVLVVLIIVEYILAQSAGSGAVRALRLLKLGRTARSFRIFKLMEQLNKIHIETGTQTNELAMVASNANDIPADESEIRKIKVLSSNFEKKQSATYFDSPSRPSLQSINERHSCDDSLILQNVQQSQSQNQNNNNSEEIRVENVNEKRYINSGGRLSLSPISKAKNEFKYDNTICIRNVSRDGGQKILFFERNAMKRLSINRTSSSTSTSSQHNQNENKARCIRLVIMPDGTKSFEEYYSVMGARVSRSYKGNFNLAIIPVEKSLPRKDSSGSISENDWRRSSHSDANISVTVTLPDNNDDEPLKLWDYPADENIFEKFLYLLIIPLHITMFYTIVDTKKPTNEKYWWLSFSQCILWIAGLSYIMVWMASEIGLTANIPEPIMGITILAAGTSIPDMLSSLAVAKRGRGDMAVSSSIGSNIFDILFGLPFPWLIKTAFVNPGSYVAINSDGMTIMVLSLFLMVAFVILSIQQCQWKLSKKLAYVFAVLYALFVCESMLIELGVIFS